MLHVNFGILSSLMWHTVDERLTLWRGCVSRSYHLSLPYNSRDL